MDSPFELPSEDPVVDLWQPHLDLRQKTRVLEQQGADQKREKCFGREVDGDDEPTITQHDNPFVGVHYAISFSCEKPKPVLGA